MSKAKSMLALTLPLIAVVFASSYGQEKKDVSPQPTREFYIKKTEPRTVATMRHKGPFSEIPTVIQKLQQEIEKGKHYVAGPVMVIFYTPAEGTPEKQRDWEVAIPVVKPGRLGGTEYDKMQFRFMDAANVVYAYHIGPRDQINDLYVRAFSWIKKMGYEIKGSPIEIYWTEPTKISSEDLVTEVWIFISEERALRPVE